MTYQQMQRSHSKRKWSLKEDLILRDVISSMAEIKWSIVSELYNKEINELKENDENSMLIGCRTNKQCRQRWQNHLNPSLSNDLKWSQEQHKALFQIYKKQSHQWCLLSALLEKQGFAKRGDNYIKNYFYSSIKRYIRKINLIITQKNQEIKKKKSQLYKYREKYAYKVRLSIQREIIQNHQESEDRQVKEALPFNPNQALSLQDGPGNKEELKILKLLDWNTLNKIFLLTQEKGKDKYMLNKNFNQSQAIQIKEKFIDFVSEQEKVQPEEIINFVINILDLSKKCKKKNIKVTNQDQIEDNLSEQEEMEQENHVQNVEIFQTQEKQKIIENNDKMQADIQQIENKSEQKKSSSVSVILIPINNHSEMKKTSSKEFQMKQKYISQNQRESYNQEENTNKFQPFMRQNQLGNNPFFSATNHAISSNMFFIQSQQYDPFFKNIQLMEKMQNQEKIFDFNESREYRTTSPFAEQKLNFQSYQYLQKKNEQNVELLESKNLNLKEFRFLNTIQELQPMQAEDLHYSQNLFEMNIPDHLSKGQNIVSPFCNLNSNVIDCSWNYRSLDQDKFASFNQNNSNPSSKFPEVSNKSKSNHNSFKGKCLKDKNHDFIGNIEGFIKNQAISMNMNKSWAYPESINNQTKNYLFSSIKFQHQNQELQKSMSLHKSSFQLFQSED